MTERTSRAAVFREAGSPLQLETAPAEIGSDGETLVRVTYCTICGSDLHTATGRRVSPTPSVLGHEIIGVVEETTGAVDIEGSPLAVGDRITWSVAASCGSCVRCESGLPQKCDHLFKYGHELYEGPYALSGGLADYCILKSTTAIVRLDESLPDRVACPANCATATVAAAMRIAGADQVRGRRVLILGAGMLGLTASAWARASGAGKIVVCDPDPQRLEQGRKFGAHTVASDPPDDSFDWVFEMSGNAAAVATAINSADIGGVITLVGSVSPGPAVPIDPERLVRRLLSIHGVHNYTPTDLRAAVEFLCLNHSRFPFETLVTQTFPLTAVNEAFRCATTHRPVRVGVAPNV